MTAATHPQQGRGAAVGTAVTGGPVRSTVLGPADPVDDLLGWRLRSRLAQAFGQIDLLEDHLALLDRRGALYASSIALHWDGQPAHFFGVVRHLVAFQAAGPAPQPDIEGWLAIGKPLHEPLLAAAWDQLRLARYGDQDLDQAQLLKANLGADPARLAASAAEMEKVVRAFPDFDALLTYARVSCVIETNGFEMPPLPES